MSAAIDCTVDSDCPHHFFSRCPGCGIEMYVLAVWDFSHGDLSCSCGHVVEPSVHRTKEVQS